MVPTTTSNSYTSSFLLDNKYCESLRAGLLCFCLKLCPLASPPSVLRVDLALGLSSLFNDEVLHKHSITLEVGRIKNLNKNPVAEKCFAELGKKLLCICLEGGPISPVSLAIATASLNNLHP